jgi:hypothetical protein
MRILKFTFLLLLASGCIFLTNGCKLDDNLLEPIGENQCLLSTQSEGGKLKVKVEYNAEQQISKYLVYNSYGNIAEQSEFLYSSNGKITIYLVRDSAGFVLAKYLYQYNSSGNLQNEKLYSNNVLLAQTTYEYDSFQRKYRERFYNADAAGVLPTVAGSTNTFSYSGNNNKPFRVYTTYQYSAATNIHDYAYDANDNMINDTYTAENSNNTTTFRVFDTKKAANIVFAGVNASSLTGTTTRNNVLSKNNLLSQTEIQTANGVEVQRSTINYTYEYDANGYAIKQTEMPLSGSPHTYVLGYFCK